VDIDAVPRYFLRRSTVWEGKDTSRDPRMVLVTRLRLRRWTAPARRRSFNHATS
jgi:hypothetical protein